jgi:hypothetical protein
VYDSNFQFSFWDSCCIGIGRHELPLLAFLGIPSFNSLFEILSHLRFRLRDVDYLSILFLRFDAVKFVQEERDDDYFQFSFWDSRVREDRRVGRGRDFQFSFWDSW